MPEAARVLVVSDDDAIRREAELGFPAGVRVTFAHDSRDAWTRLRDEVPSVVVVDMQTGKAGGYNLARDMAADARLADVPVLILLERDQDAWLAGQAGARGHLTKPVVAARLVARTLSLAAATPA